MTVRDTRPEPVRGGPVDRAILRRGTCPDCQAVYGNYHNVGCTFGGIVGSAREPARSADQASGLPAPRRFCPDCGQPIGGGPGARATR